MKQDIILVGAGGCMRELLWQMEELNRENVIWEVLGYVDKKSSVKKECSGISVGTKSYPYLGEDDYLLNLNQEMNVAVCIGEPSLRKKITQKLMKNSNLKFPNIIFENVCISSSVSMGKGCIISMDCRISTDVRLGDFVFLNIGTVVSHDGEMGDYVTLGPDVKIAGNVTVGRESYLGLGTKIIQGIQVGQQVTSGAGSVVVKNVKDSCTVVGVPAKEIR